jgi:hypothetical protein
MEFPVNQEEEIEPCQGGFSLLVDGVRIAVLRVVGGITWDRVR